MSEQEQGLQKSLKKRHINMITIGGVIGAGLFMGSGSVIKTAGPAAILCYALAGLIVLCIMRMLGEMAVANPTSASFSVYASDAIGPWAGYTIGWLYWYQWVTVIAFEATAAAVILHQMIPVIPIWVYGLSVTIILTLVNLTSVKNYGEFEYWFAMIKVITIVGFLLIGIAYIAGMIPGTAAPGTSNLLGRGGFMPNGISSVAAGMLVVCFSYFGTEVATIAAAETTEPAKNIKMAINSVVGRILLFYIGSISVIVFILPWDSALLLQSPFVAVMELAGVPIAAKIINFVVLTAVLSCLNSGLYVTSRMIYGMSLNGNGPKVLQKLNRASVPYIAVILGSTISVIVTVFNYISPEVVFAFLMNSAGAVALAVYLIIAISQIMSRRKAEKANQHIEVKMWCFPYLSYLVVAAIATILIGMLFNPGTRTQVILTAIVAAIILCTYFAFFNKGKSNKPSA